jgi:chromate transporter
MVLIQLFLVFLKIGLFAIGGAYSFLPLLEQEVVRNHGWLAKSEFLEVTGIVECFPGAISIKFATYTGYKVAGISGAIVANIANLLPPVLFMTMAMLLYRRYSGEASARAALTMVRYAVLAMMMAIPLRLVDLRSLLEPKVAILVIGSFLLMAMTRVHPAVIIVAAAVYGGFLRAAP